jgi:hypothetical protein
MKINTSHQDRQNTDDRLFPAGSAIVARNPCLRKLAPIGWRHPDRERAAGAVVHRDLLPDLLMGRPRRFGRSW